MFFCWGLRMTSLIWFVWLCICFNSLFCGHFSIKCLLLNHLKPQFSYLLYFPSANTAFKVSFPSLCIHIFCQIHNFSQPNFPNSWLVPSDLIDLPGSSLFLLWTWQTASRSVCIPLSRESPLSPSFIVWAELVEIQCGNVPHCYSL